MACVGRDMVNTARGEINVTLQCCVTVSVHVGIHVMTLYDVTGFNNIVSTMCTRREVRCMMGD